MTFPIASLLPLRILDHCIVCVRNVFLVSLLLFVVAGVLGLLSARKSHSRRQQHIVKLWLIAFLLCFLSGFQLPLIGSVLCRKARREVLSALENIDVTTATLTLDSLPPLRNSPLLPDIKATRFVWAHHTYAINIVTCEISDSNTRLLLRIGRDSTNTNEYWVFYPKYKFTRKNEIGRFYSETAHTFLTSEPTSASVADPNL